MRLVRVEQSTDVVDVVECEAPQQSQRAACPRVRVVGVRVVGVRVVGVRVVGVRVVGVRVVVLVVLVLVVEAVAAAGEWRV